MAIRDILAQLDVRVEGASSVAQMNAALDKTVAQVAPAGRAFENMRIAERNARNEAARLTAEIRKLERAEDANGAQLDELRRKLVRTEEAARRYGQRAAQLRGTQTRAAGSTGGLIAGLGRATVALAAVGAATATARAAIGHLVDAFREVVELGDNLDKTAQQIGLTTAQLQIWRFTADRAGVDARAMDQSFMRLQRAAFEASRGNRTYARAFDRLGVSVRGADGELLSADALMREMARGMSGLENETERVALAQQVMGRSGARLLPMLNQGEEGLAAMAERARELGGGLSADVVEASAGAQDSMTDFRLAMTSLKSVLAANVLPAVTAVVSAIATGVGWFVRLARSTSIVETVIGGLAVSMALFTLAMLPALAPMLLIIAAMGLVFLAVEDVVTAFRGGDSVLSRFVEQMFAAMGVTTTFEGVIERFGVGWDVAVAQARNAIAELLDSLVRLRRSMGLGVSPDLEEAAAGARRSAREARTTATRSRSQLREHERARFEARAARDAEINAPPPPVVEGRRAARARREAQAESRVLAPTTIQVNGAQDPEAVARQVERRLRRRFREAADSQPLVPEPA